MHHQKLFQFRGRTARLRAILAAAGSRRQAADKIKDEDRRLAMEVEELRGGRR